jgi:hypothetical protein
MVGSGAVAAVDDDDAAFSFPLELHAPSAATPTTTTARTL